METARRQVRREKHPNTPMTMEPANQGYALPSITATLSPAAASLRAAAIAANVSSYELPVKPRSIVNQQELPCCVSTALGAAMEVLTPNSPALAPLFHYYVTRYDNKGADPHGFLFLENGLDTLTDDGICRQDLHAKPYTQAGAAARPSSDAYADGQSRAIGRRDLRVRFNQVDGPSRVVWIRDQLRQNCPVVMGIQLPIGYYKSFLNSNFEWLDPNNPPRSMSGHCVLVFGYNDARQAFHVQDSRGEGEFQKGCWWIGYRVVDSTVVQDAYSLLP